MTRSKLTHMIVLWRLRDAPRNCHKIIDLPSGTYLETAKSKYNNGVFEITFGKKEETKPKKKYMQEALILRPFPFFYLSISGC